jgi:hypothetical protein
MFRYLLVDDINTPDTGVFSSWSSNVFSLACVSNIAILFCEGDTCYQQTLSMNVVNIWQYISLWQLCSLKNIRSRSTMHPTDEHLQGCMEIATTQIKPDTDKLLKRKYCYTSVLLFMSMGDHGSPTRLLIFPRRYMIMESHGKMILTGDNRITIPVPLYPPQIPHGLTRASAGK